MMDYLICWTIPVEEGGRSVELYSGTLLEPHGDRLDHVVEAVDPGHKLGRRRAADLVNSKPIRKNMTFFGGIQSYHNTTRRLTDIHGLPQTPAEDSQWFKDFTEDERSAWTDKLGNLVLITRRKNSSQGRVDYGEKKKNYFRKSIDTCPNSLRVLQTYRQWRPLDLEQNHKIVIEKLYEHYGIARNADLASS